MITLHLQPPPQLKLLSQEKWPKNGTVIKKVLVVDAKKTKTVREFLFSLDDAAKYIL